jgi:hypothetical protein
MIRFVVQCLGRDLSRISNYLLIILILLSFSPVKASEGWDHIKNNNNKEARKAFQQVLDADSLNEDALKGMIFLCDIEQNDLSFRKYVNTYIRHYPDEHFYLLFQNIYNGKPEKMVEKVNFSEKAKIASRMEIAGDLEHDRKFAESDKAYKAIVPDYKWSMIGPFKNVQGSGYVVEHPIEKEKYNSKSIYYTEAGMPLQWVRPLYVNNVGTVYFGDHLPDNYYGSVYFANTFFFVPEPQTIQIRLSRAAPMKIWLDDRLVFENKEAISSRWDNEVIELSIGQGNHRLLVKNATSGSRPKSYPFLRFYDGGESAYFNGDDDHSSMFLSSYMMNRSGENSFSLRITDNKGVTQTKVTPSFNEEYPSGETFKVTQTTSLEEINYYQQQLKQNPEEWFNYYLLLKAYYDAGLVRKCEEQYVKVYREHKSSAFFKYLMAKIYAQNGKIEKVYEVLNEIDMDKTPVFGLLYKKFSDIDMQHEEQKYIRTLDNLRTITPSNYSVISAYIRYYSKKAMQKEKEDFIKEMQEKYPLYKNRLQYELERDDNKPYKEQTDKERDKEIKESIKNLKSHFESYDYTAAISYYKGKEKKKKVLELYDELIRYVPYENSYRKDKARFLYSEERYQEAMKELEEVLKIAPYDGETMEQIGDIYYDMDKNNNDNRQKALHYYQKALRLEQTSGNSYGLESLIDKIEKIEGQKTMKSLFVTKSFDDILNDPAWKVNYEGEESVILLFTRDLVYDSTARVEVFQQFMVKVLTEAGVKRWTEYDFSFMGDLGTVKVIKPNGTEFSPDRSGGSVVFKNLEPGDIIQIDGVYKWQQFSELDRELYMIHYSSFEAPIYYSKFEVAVPSGQFLAHQTHLLEDKLVRSSKNGYDFYTWEYNQLPKVENEDAIVDGYDVYSNIMISTMPDWSKVVEWYEGKTYRKLEMTYDVKEVLDSIITPAMTPNQKVEAIYNYLTRQIKYSYVPFLQSGYTPKNTGLTLSARLGDCKDVATLMIAMLREVGIESYYTLVKTNSFNHLSILPSLYFDHVVAAYTIDGKTNYLDMTTDFYPNYVLTENDINAVALTIKKGEKEIFRLPQDDLDSLKNKVEMVIDATLDLDRTIRVEASATYPGIAGGNMREVFSSISEVEKKNYVIDLIGSDVFPDMELSQYKFDNTEEITQPLRSSYSVKANEFSDSVANLQIFRVPFINAIRANAVISGSQRHNRIDVEKLTYSDPSLQKVTLHFPKSYKLVQVPKDIHIKGKYGVYRVRFKSIPGGLYIEKYQSFTVRYIDAKEFAEFKDYYLKLLKADKTKIAIQQTKG